MNPRFLATIGAIIMIGTGFACGYLVGSRGKTRPLQPQAKDPQTLVAAWQYPGAKQLHGTTSGPLYQAVFTTPDSIDQVAAWYGKLAGHPLVVDKHDKAGPWSGTGDDPTAVLND